MSKKIFIGPGVMDTDSDLTTLDHNKILDMILPAIARESARRHKAWHKATRIKPANNPTK